jgi:hypothetical protein
MIMKITKLIETVFEQEVRENRSRIPPVPPYIPGGLLRGPKKNIKPAFRRGGFMDLGLAAGFIIILMVSVFWEDGVFRSPLTGQGAFIARVFSENTGRNFYDFISAIHSSF